MNDVNVQHALLDHGPISREYIYSKEHYEFIVQQCTSDDVDDRRSGRHMERILHSYHKKLALQAIEKEGDELHVRLCHCGCGESVLQSFRERRSSIYAALWSLKQGCAGEAWGDIFVGGLGQMLWTFPLL